MGSYYWTNFYVSSIIQNEFQTRGSFTPATPITTHPIPKRIPKRLTQIRVKQIRVFYLCSVIFIKIHYNYALVLLILHLPKTQRVCYIEVNFKANDHVSPTYSVRYKCVCSIRVSHRSLTEIRPVPRKVFVITRCLLYSMSDTERFDYVHSCRHLNLIKMLEETLYQPQSLVSAKANIYKIKLVSPKIISLIKLFQSLK